MSVGRREFLKLTSGALGGLMLTGFLSGCTTEEKSGATTGQQEKVEELLEKIVLFGPMAPLTIPLAVIKDQNTLSHISKMVDFSVWSNPDQLRAQITSDQVHFAALPTNVAANFYNRGVGLQLLNVAIWGNLYLVTSESNVKTLEEIKGQEIVVPFKGDMPDLVFQYLCKQKGINPLTDYKIRYVSTPVEAAQLVASGQVKHGVLSEPAATAAIMGAKKNGKELYRMVDLQELWGQVTGRQALIPQAGIVALPSILKDNKQVIPQFQQAYKDALTWVGENGQAAGKVGETYIEGLKAGPVAKSLEYTRLKFVSAQDAKEDLEFFYKALAELSPELIGGKLPDAPFYYEEV